MNAIHQISLKLRLGIDPACQMEPDQLLQRWKSFSEESWQRQAAIMPDGKPRVGLAPARTQSQPKQ